MGIAGLLFSLIVMSVLIWMEKKRERSERCWDILFLPAFVVFGIVVFSVQSIWYRTIPTALMDFLQVLVALGVVLILVVALPAILLFSLCLFRSCSFKRAQRMLRRCMRVLPALVSTRGRAYRLRYALRFVRSARTMSAMYLLCVVVSVCIARLLLTVVATADTVSLLLDSQASQMIAQEELRLSFQKEYGYRLYSHREDRIIYVAPDGKLKKVVQSIPERKETIVIRSNDAYDCAHPQRDYTVVRGADLTEPIFTTYRFLSGSR